MVTVNHYIHRVLMCYYRGYALGVALRKCIKVGHFEWLTIEGVRFTSHG